MTSSDVLPTCGWYGISDRSQPHSLRGHNPLILIISSTPKPYHMSILSGQGWVEELLEGHPAWIQCELGVSQDIFLELVAALESFGHEDSKYVKIEEQLAIFLYISITGLTIQHMREHFQQPNETISKYLHLMLNIFSSDPCYTTYVNLPNANTPPSWHLSHNPKMWPLFQFTLGALDGSHIMCAPALYSHAPYWNYKGLYLKTVSSHCGSELGSILWCQGSE